MVWDGSMLAEICGNGQLKVGHRLFFMGLPVEAAVQA